MLAGCLILAADGSDASDSGFLWDYATRRNVVWADRPSTTSRAGPSRMIGLNRRDDRQYD
jgi:hypothetical protein